MEIKVQLTDHPKAKTPESELGFGKVFTDHMFINGLRLKDTAGTTPSIVPYGPISLDPGLPRASTTPRRPSRA